MIAYLDFFVFSQKEKKKNLHSRPAVSTNHDALNTIFVIWYQKSTAEPLLAGSTVLLKSVPEKKVDKYYQTKIMLIVLYQQT